MPFTDDESGETVSGGDVMTTRRLRWDFRKGLGPMVRRANYTRYRVEVVGDVFAPGVTRSEQDMVFAVIASRGGWEFVLRTLYPKRLTAFMTSVETRSIGAAERYERRVRGHFQKYKCKFTEGYTLPEPPTAQLRVIYDSAAKTERRATRPCGYTLSAGFSLGEYHWRSWPLNNVRIIEQGSRGDS